jgi:hypothetical protein
MWPSSPGSIQDNYTIQYSDAPCITWSAVQWTTDPKGSVAQAASWYSGYMSHSFWDFAKNANP